jgi:hypothetical protein
LWSITIPQQGSGSPAFDLSVTVVSDAGDVDMWV